MRDDPFVLCVFQGARSHAFDKHVSVRKPEMKCETVYHLYAVVVHLDMLNIR